MSVPFSSRWVAKLCLSVCTVALFSNGARFYRVVSHWFLFVFKVTIKTRPQYNPNMCKSRGRFVKCEERGE